jgi:hypothetical protein
MTKFLANENVPGAAIEAARQAGVDITWVRDISPALATTLYWPSRKRRGECC